MSEPIREILKDTTIFSLLNGCQHREECRKQADRIAELERKLRMQITVNRDQDESYSKRITELEAERDSLIANYDKSDIELEKENITLKAENTRLQGQIRKFRIFSTACISHGTPMENGDKKIFIKVPRGTYLAVLEDK